MNRRQFTTSLGAISGAAVLPMPAAITISAPLPQAVSRSTYKWAQLIARAQTKVSPATLARHLRLGPDVAQGVFDTLVRDGTLRVPSSVGLAKAVNPLQTTGHATPNQQTFVTRAEKMLRRVTETEPLVKDGDPALGCSNTIDKDAPHASSDEPVQESPKSR